MLPMFHLHNLCLYIHLIILLQAQPTFTKVAGQVKYYDELFTLVRRLYASGPSTRSLNPAAER